MSSIGKVFVVLNLVFSLVILAVVGAILSQSENFKERYVAVDTEYKAEKSKWDEEKNNLQTKIDGHERDKLGLSTKLSDSEVEIRSLTAERDELKVDLATAQQNVSKIEANLRTFTTTQSELQSHNKQLVDSNTDMIQQRNDAVDAQRVAEEDAARMRAENSRFQEAISQLQSQIEALEAERGDLSAQIEAAVQSGFDISKVRAFPKIDGRVQSVNTDLGIVVLSVGRDDGVSRGAVFQVYGGQYKGKVIVEDVFPDNCSARIVPNSSGMTIQVMDRATTRI